MSEKVVKNSQLDHYLSTIPPQNLEAEEWILGGIMLDPGAIDRVVDLLTPEAFYFSDHQEIYRAALALYREEKSTDFMAVTSWLYDHKKLDKVGGQSKIAQLIERTVSAVNIDRYAALVMDKFLRRQLIQSGNEIVKIGNDLLYTQEECIDRARQKLDKILLIPLKHEDKLKTKHKKLIAEIEKVELEEEDPSFKYLKIKEIAKRFKLSVKEVDEIWLKYLIYSEGSGELKSFQQLLEQGSDYTRWLIQGILREVGLTVLHAPGGGLKTTIAMDWIFSLLKGIPWEGFPTTSKKRRALIIQTDENVSDTIPSLIARGYDETLDISFVDRWNIQNTAAFNRYLSEFNPDVVLIDSLFSVSSGSLYSENDAEYARPLLQINKYAQERGTHVILIHHSNAEGGLRGTGAIKASATAVMSLAADPDHPGPDSPWRILTIEKFRGRCQARYSLEFFAENRRFICHGEYKKQDESFSLKDRIVKFLAAHRNTRYEIDELMEFCGGARASVRRAAGQLSSAGIINSCRQSPQSKKMVYFLEWEGEDDGGGDWNGDDIDPTSPNDPSSDNRIANGSLDDHLNGSLVESPPPEDYSDSGIAKDPMITKNQLFQSGETGTEKPEGMIAQEGVEAETQTQQEEQPSSTSDPLSDHQVITPRSATDDVITKDHVPEAPESLQDRIAIENYRGLTVKQPRAQRFIQGLQWYEVRGQKTNYRGLVLIHSSQEYEKGFRMDRTLAAVEYPTGKVLAVAELTDCIEITEALINEQPDTELAGGNWRPGRWAWKLENIRPVRPYPGAAGGSTVLWNPAIDHLEGVKIGNRVDDPTDDCWTGVRNCVSEVTRHPELREEILKLYSFLSDRQRAEVMRRLSVLPVTDETITDETVTTPDIFDRIQVGDRLIRQDKVYIVINKSLSPKRVEITNRSDCARRLFPYELEVLDFLHKPLKFGTCVRWGEHCGELVQRCKNHKWYVKWQKRSDTWLERYGKPPSKALSPNEFEVIEWT